MDTERIDKKQKRSAIAKIVREHTGLKSCGGYYCDKRTSNHPSNVYGHTMKWWLGCVKPQKLMKVNAALKPLGVECRITRCGYVAHRPTCALQVFMLP